MRDKDIIIILEQKLSVNNAEIHCDSFFYKWGVISLHR